MDFSCDDFGGVPWTGGWGGGSPAPMLPAGEICRRGLVALMVLAAGIMVCVLGGARNYADVWQRLPVAMVCGVMAGMFGCMTCLFPRTAEEAEADPEVETEAALDANVAEEQA